MNKLLLLTFTLIVCTTLITTAQIIPDTFHGNLTTNNLQFSRPNTGTPPVTTISGSRYYTVIPISITTPGTYSFRAYSSFINQGSPFDNFGILYDIGGFNPTDPLTNAIAANDDFGGTTNFNIMQTLTTTGIYYLVVSSFNVNNLGGFSIIVSGTPIIPLPLNLINFTGITNTGYNQISWNTANEKNTASFNLERSTNALEYHQFGKIAANGSGNNYYTYKDENINESTIYYRLKMIDLDGTFTYSKTIHIYNASISDNKVLLFPNPASHVININIKNSLLGTQANIINSIGQRISTFTVLQNNEVIDISNLPSGAYYIQLQDGSFNKFNKLD